MKDMTNPKFSACTRLEKGMKLPESQTGDLPSLDGLDNSSASSHWHFLRLSSLTEELFLNA